MPAGSSGLTPVPPFGCAAFAVPAEAQSLSAIKARARGGARQARARENVSFRISATTRIVIGSALFALASSALLYLLPPSPADPTLRGTFRFLQGHAYLIPVKYFSGELNAARLYEDDRPLGPANSDRREIETKGAGRFELHRDTTNWFGPVLVFSTSDNTDPNKNGRKYRLE